METKSKCVRLVRVSIALAALVIVGSLFVPSPSALVRAQSHTEYVFDKFAELQDRVAQIETMLKERTLSSISQNVNVELLEPNCCETHMIKGTGPGHLNKAIENLVLARITYDKKENIDNGKESRYTIVPASLISD